MDIRMNDSEMYVHVQQVAERITRVVYNFSKEIPGKSILISEDFKPAVNLTAGSFRVEAGAISFADKKGEVILKETGRSLAEKDVYKYSVDGKPIVRYKLTANGEVAYIENMTEEVYSKAYEGKLTFAVTGDEALYGLGQHENGVYNYNKSVGNFPDAEEFTEYLYQNNMIIAIPFLVSSRNYGILIDTETSMIFDCRAGEMTFTLDTADELSYYVITGENFEEIIQGLRSLTGRTPMLPRWAYGYVQSRERYNSSGDLLQAVKGFRDSGIPLDCIVQDWHTWEEGLWGDKHVDRKRYPDLKMLIDSLHKEHVALMVSIWPNMAEGSRNQIEFSEKGLLLPNTTTYDAFNEEARALYWKQCEEEWFSSGADAWWCDSSEPFTDPDWNGERKRPEELRYQMVVDASKRAMDWTKLNSYGLLHAKGIYENWRKTGSEKRVTNLTRSAYISGQKYGTILWSGDISAKWSTLRSQVTEGIKFCLSGMPYWTLDIGAFFTVRDKYENRGCDCNTNTNPLWFWDGDYNEGVNDLGYRELYVRWLQYGTFLPMFRSHGTDTPREPWNFGKPGEIFYDTILKFIRLRYRLLPYIYSLAAEITQKNASMLRSLMFDFAGDARVKEISDSYMFGKALLVCPVTEPMYYGVNSTPLENTVKTRTVYLPEGTGWFDFWTNKPYRGGQTLVCDAPLDMMPLFVRAGSIIPTSAPVMYAGEKGGEVSEILIYGGTDGEFVLYNDEGDNYSYEKGNYCSIPLHYRDTEKMLTFGKAVGAYKHQENFKIRWIGTDGNSRVVEFAYSGKDAAVKI